MNVSRLPQARGLKRQINCFCRRKDIVAPPTGAWIETDKRDLLDKNRRVAPPTGAWIETSSWKSSSSPSVVAPPTGAWIETSLRCYSLPQVTSRLPQARGLKQKVGDNRSWLLWSRLPQARGLKRGNGSSTSIGDGRASHRRVD